MCAFLGGLGDGFIFILVGASGRPILVKVYQVTQWSLIKFSENLELCLRIRIVIHSIKLIAKAPMKAKNGWQWDELTAFWVLSPKVTF